MHRTQVAGSPPSVNYIVKAAKGLRPRGLEMPCRFAKVPFGFDNRRLPQDKLHLLRISSFTEVISSGLAGYAHLNFPNWMKNLYGSAVSAHEDHGNSAPKHIR